MIITKPTGQLRHPQAVRKSAPDFESARATLAAHLALAAGEPIPVRKVSPDQAARDSGVCSGCHECRPGTAGAVCAELERAERKRRDRLMDIGLGVVVLLLIAFVAIKEIAK